MGQNDELVAAGSDDGNVFIYSVATGQPVRVIKADSDVANCVQVSLQIHLSKSVAVICNSLLSPIPSGPWYVQRLFVHQPLLSRKHGLNVFLR